MAGPANPHAMAPPTPGPTRTAPPQMPSSWWSAPRIRTYLLFDATGIVYLLAGFVALRLVWSLGQGEEAYQAVLAGYSNPLYIAFHALTLASLVQGAQEFYRFTPTAKEPVQIFDSVSLDVDVSIQVLAKRNVKRSNPYLQFTISINI